MTTRTVPLAGERREEFAARLIVEANTDYTLDVVDDGSANNLVDYRVLDRDGLPVGTLEVGRNTVPAARKADDAYRKNVAGPQRIAGLTKTWLVFCERDGTRFNLLLRQLAPLLRELESAERTTVDTYGAYPYGGRETTVEWRLAVLGIRRVSSFDPRDDGPEVHIESTYGWNSSLGPDITLAEAEAWLSSDGADQRGARRKLAAEGLPERHMFLWVDRHNVQASRGLAEPELPTRNPALPPEVTHLWLTADSGLRGIGGWHWSSTRKWSQLDEVEPSVDQSVTHFAT